MPHNFLMAMGTNLKKDNAKISIYLGLLPNAPPSHATSI